MQRYFSSAANGTRAARRIVAILLTLTGWHGSAAAVEPPKDSPAAAEVDETKEVIAVSIGGRAALVQISEDAQIMRVEGSRVAPVTASRKGRSDTDLPCSRTSSSADGRADCEAEARLDLPRIAPGNAEQMNRANAARLTPASFTRKSLKTGTLNVRTPRGAIRIPISTRDQVLTRVRLLGLTNDGVAVVLAESLRQNGEVLRWRSLISGFDRTGRLLGRTVEIDSSRKGLPNGDYAVVNDKGELGIIRMVSGAPTIEWQSLLANVAAPARPPAAAAAMPLANASPAEAAAADFDLDKFAQISAGLDGDPGRASDRPITRREVRANIDQYLEVEWTMAAANYTRAGMDNLCRPSQAKYWLRPRRLNDSVGDRVAAVPYKWGGYVSVEAFLARLKRNDLAGSVCTCNDPQRNYCIVANAAGIDCSGFVSRVWGVDRYTTGSLEEITTSIPWQELKEGDAVNKPRDHVRVFLERFDEEDADLGFKIAESSVSCGGVCVKVIGARELDGYEPRRFNHIVE
jgi:hypothetical protein